MAEIIKNRIIRPSSRLKISKNYKIHTKKVSKNDTLIVNIKHESKPFHRTYQFKGSDLDGRRSIHYKVIKDDGTDVVIEWIKVSPCSS
jgi:hypothetical protein